MSTNENMFAQHGNVLALSQGLLVAVHYDSIPVGSPYSVKLLTGSYAVYVKTALFDDALVERVNSKGQAESLLHSLSSNSGSAGGAR